MRLAPMAVGLMTLSCSSGGSTGVDAGPPGQGHFTYGVQKKVYRIEARVGATPQNISAAFEKFGTGTDDRWLVPSHNGSHLAVSTDRLSCSMGECLASGPGDLSSLSLVRAGGNEVVIEGIPAIANSGDTLVYPAQGGPHMRDLFLTKKTGTTWSAPTLLTGASPYPYNNMPGLTFDQKRALFDCGMAPYPEGGVNDSCEVALDGSGFRVVVQSTTLPGSRQMHVQFPRDSLDGVLFESAWPLDGGSPETIWLRSGSGTPTPIGKNFNNAVSPCGLRDGRFGVLWLGRPGNASGAHELSLASRDGTVLGALTPDVDVDDIGIGCSD